MTDTEDDVDDDAEDETPVYAPPISVTNAKPSSSDSSSPSAGSRATKAANIRKRLLRDVRRAIQQGSLNTTQKSVLMKHRRKVTPAFFDFDTAEDVHPSKPGWTGSSSELHSLKRTLSLAEVLEMGLKEYAWDGK